MSSQPQNPFAQNYQPAPARKGAGPLWWLLGGSALIVLICCGGVLAGLFYIGVQGPETSVYVGNQIPNRFLDTAREVGALEQGERVRFFYSDALADITEGFYFVSDRKVAVYVDDGRDAPLEVIPYDEIKDVNLFRNESFFEDSEITIETTDGELIAFPVSSEFDRDVQFFEAIQAGLPESP